jgi:hypothetical protein
MKTKKIIKRNLPLNDAYNFIGIFDNGEMNFNTCENCGKPIRYVVELKNSSNKSYFVGTECSKTLQKCNISNEFSMIEEINAFKKLSTAKNLLLNGSNIRIWNGFDYSVIVGLNSRGNAKKIKIENIWDIFKQKNYSFIENFLTELKNNKNSISENWCFNDIFKYLDYLKTI